MRTTAILLVTLLASGTFAQTDRKYIRKGNGNYGDGNFQQAEVEYRKALEENPASAKADYNLGNALYRQQQFDAAASKYESLTERESNRKNLGRYYYNLGNTLYQKKQYGESVEAFKNALRNNPADMDAKHNLQMAMKMLQSQQQQQQQQQQNKKDDQQQKENQQNQQKDDKNNQDKNDQQQQQQNQQNQPDQQQQQQQRKDQISAEDAERLLKALENEEKEVLKRVQERKERSGKVQVEKNW